MPIIALHDGICIMKMPIIFIVCIMFVYLYVLTVTPGKGVTSDPVAIKMFLVFMTSLPFSPVTSTFLGFIIVPTPRTSFT